MWVPTWTRTGYSAVRGLHVDSSTTPPQIGVLTYPDDTNMAVVYDAPGSSAKRAWRSPPRCFLSAPIPHGEETWLAIDDLDGRNQQAQIGADGSFHPLAFDKVKAMHVGLVHGNERFFAGTGLSFSSSALWDAQTQTATEVVDPPYTEHYSAQVTNEGFLYVALLPGGGGSDARFLKSGADAAVTVVTAQAGKHVVTMRMASNKLLWFESSVSPSAGVGPGELLIADWSPEGPFPLTGTVVASVPQARALLASGKYAAVHDSEQDKITVITLEDGTVAFLPIPVDNPQAINGIFYVGEDGLGGEGLWLNTFDAVYRLGLP